MVRKKKRMGIGWDNQIGKRDGMDQQEEESTQD
jgi:hypothetical protein